MRMSGIKTYQDVRNRVVPVFVGRASLAEGRMCHGVEAGERQTCPNNKRAGKAQADRTR